LPLSFSYEEIAGKFYPIIPIELESKDRSILTRVYVDSGATFSIFNSEIATYLNIDYRRGEKIFPTGIGGHIHAYLNDVVLRLENIEMPCKVLFSDEFAVKFSLLGRAPLFDKFKICFDDVEKKLYLYEK
jgi:hypothetical protein